MKKLLTILLLTSCTHQVYVAQKVIPTDKGLIRVGEAEKIVPNDSTIYTILFQASAIGKRKGN